MHFQIKTIENAHYEVGTCLSWLNQSQAITCGDDHCVTQWNLLSFTSIKTMKLEDDFYPTDLAIIKHLTFVDKDDSKKDEQQIKLVLACSNGKFHFINFTFEKIEKSIDAHEGAILSLKLNLDESALLTSGEDGQIKIWSKTGSLRYVLEVEPFPIFNALWSFDLTERIIYSSNDIIHIKPLIPNSKSIKWTAHKNNICNLDWNIKYKILLSLDEKSKIKIWDNFGNHLKTIQSQESINCLEWNLEGEKFVCGGYNCLQLYDRHGYLIFSQNLNNIKKNLEIKIDKNENQRENLNDKILNIDNFFINNELNTIKNLVKINWCLDSNSVLSLSRCGQLIYGYIVNKIVEWSSYCLKVINCRKLILKNILNNFEQELDLNEIILNFSLKFNHLIVLCINQCFIYKLKELDALNFEYWNENFNSINLQLYNVNFHLILQSQKQFSLISDKQIFFFNYEGRKLLVLDNLNLAKQRLNKTNLSLTDSCFAMQDLVDTRIIKFFNLNLRQDTFQLNQIKFVNQIEFIHEHEIINLKLNTNKCNSNEQKCAFIDKNQDMYLILIKPSSINVQSKFKLMSQCTSLEWNEKFGILACTNENYLNIFIYPDAIFIDRELFSLSKIIKEINFNENQKKKQHLKIDSFYQEQIKLFNQSLNQFTCMINSFYLLLHEYFANEKYKYALNLCRLDLNNISSKIHQIKNSFLNNVELWATFTAMSLKIRNLELVEEGYTNLDIHERVLYIKKIKDIYNQILNENLNLIPVNSRKLIIAETIKKGELSLMCTNGFHETELHFLNLGLILRLIFVYLNSFKWQEAINLAEKYDKICSKKIYNFLNIKGLINPDDIQINSFLTRIIVTYRKNFLHRFNLEEMNPIFIQLMEKFILLDFPIFHELEQHQHDIFFDLNT